MLRRMLSLALALAVTGVAPILSRASDGATDVAGIPAEKVGLHGPTENITRNLRLVGHTPLPDELTGLPVGNNGGVALIDDCAYIGRWHDYTGRRPVQIVDVSDPTAPVIVRDGNPDTADGVPDSARNGGVSREIRAIDLPDFELLVVMVFSQGTGDRVNNRLLFYTFPTGDCRAPKLAGTFDMRAFRGHEFFLWADPVNEVDGHPRVLVYVTAPVTAPNVLVVDASDPAAPALAGVYDAGMPVVSPREPAGAFLGTYAHSISVSDDGTEAYLSYWDGGFLTVDTSAFAQGLPAGAIRPKGAQSVPLQYPLDQMGNTHSAVRIGETDDVAVGDEIYISTDGCPFGWLRVIRSGDETTPPTQVGEYRLAENRAENCTGVTLPNGTVRPFPNVRNAAGALVDGTFTMHNQTVTDGYVITSWYGGGLRVIDVGDPTAPAEVGVFVPEPMTETATAPSTSAPTYGVDADPDNDWWVATWSYPIVRDGLIYVADVRNGLYILEADDGAPFGPELEAIAFLEGNSNLGALR